MFVHPENTNKHEKWLARETRKSSKTRVAYKAKRWAEKQQKSEVAESGRTEETEMTGTEDGTSKRRVASPSA